ncbi:MAG: hypothetical protein NT062_10360 [Proteobacteria bacterium]|nr:hypothetical protein [Pseudomonadota bacterium]
MAFRHSWFGLLVGLLACGKATDAPQGRDRDVAPTAKKIARDAAPAPDAAEVALATTSYATLADALAATIPADAKVIGFGELHARTDRDAVKSALVRFTEDALPSLGPKLSDLVIETWVVDPTCGKAAEVSVKVSMSMRRPQETKSEIGELAARAAKAKVQPHAMTVTCDDYAKIAPSGTVDPEALLGIATRELGRLVEAAVKAPSKATTGRPWIAVYGGALHNDRFPTKGVEEWSYAARADAATADHFVEIDLVAPELAATDPASQRQPWFPLVARADHQVTVWKRGERSFVVLLPRS